MSTPPPVTEDPFVVFLLGVRLNHKWAVHRWRPAQQAMMTMLAELQSTPQSGLLGASSGCMFGGPATVQYWAS